jgi:glycosyltransferase involved in cell wall biosynthesis
VTYLVANFNKGWAFPDLLDSLEAQINTNWYCLVCDDASTDESFGQIQDRLHQSPVRHQVQLLQNHRNLGLTNTLRRLISEAQTDILAVLDADDALEPEATEEFLLAYARVPEAGFVYSRFTFLDTDLSTVLGIFGAPVPLGGTSMQGGQVSHLRSFRKRVYRETAGLDPGILYAEDRDLIYKLEEVTEPLFIDKPLYRYRYVPGSQSMHPRKRLIGYFHHGRAWHRALRRRDVGRLAWLVATAHYWLHLPVAPFKWVPSLRKLVYAADRRVNWHAKIRLKRDARWCGFTPGP